MTKPPMPADEEARLRDLQSYEILDTPPERDYDDIALLAAQICGVPIAAVNLIDKDRYWLKARIGIEGADGAREDSFCSHAVASADPRPLVVEDAAQDERFLANPYVTGDPNIRFYAGAPIVTPDNHALGTLCVVDSRPRRLTPAQLDALQALARQVAMKLELRRVSIQLRQSNERLQSLSLTDDLTGLYNRRGFLLHAEQQLKLFRSRRGAGGSLGVLMADMDRLKPINDRFGHDEGSAALVAMADALRKTFRDADIVARLGGDEFAVLIINAAPDAEQSIVRRLRAKLAEHNAASGKPYQISASCGLHFAAVGDAASIEEIMRRADEAMYQDKRGKKAARG